MKLRPVGKEEQKPVADPNQQVLKVAKSLPLEGIAPEPKIEKRHYRYVCYGCTANAGWFATPAANLRVICSRCGKDQLSELQHFIYDPQ